MRPKVANITNFWSFACVRHLWGRRCVEVGLSAGFVRYAHSTRRLPTFAAYGDARLWIVATPTAEQLPHKYAMQIMLNFEAGLGRSNPHFCKIRVSAFSLFSAQNVRIWLSFLTLILNVC